MAVQSHRLSTLLESPSGGNKPPTAAELAAIGRLAADLGRAGRVQAVNAIGSQLGVPAGGWPSGQSKLFERGDVRLTGLFSLFSRPRMAAAIANNLARVAQFGAVSPMLSLVTAQREHGSAVYAAGRGMIDSFWQGGLDHLWPERNRLGLPPSVVGRWERIPPYPNPDAHLPLSQRPPDVEPARIPAGDQVLIYAAQINASYLRFQTLLSSLRRRALSSRVGTMIWQALCFLAPGGARFDREKPLEVQIGQRFGAQSILEYLAQRSATGELNLDGVFETRELNASAWVRSAKIRTTEALFLERLLTTVRDLKLAGS
jgi:hypothetical protein